MKFDQIIYENVKKAKLKRVRIKCDPRFTSSENFAFIDSYEGYILEEEDEIVKVMIIKQGMPTFRIPLELTQPETEPVIDPCNLCSFKTFIIEKLQAGDPLIEIIKNCQAVEEIESVLIQNNYTPDRVLKIYRQYINGDKTTLSESILDTLKTVGKGVGNALLNAGDTAQKIKGVSDQLSQGNYGQLAKQARDTWKTALGNTQDKQFNALIKKHEWPQGYPKKDGKVKLINRNSPLNDKPITINKIQKVNTNNVYWGVFSGVNATKLGIIGCIITQTVDGENIDDHSVNVKITEGQNISHTYNSNYKDGDTYILQFNPDPTDGGFELVEYAFNSRGDDIIFTVGADRSWKLGQQINNLQSIASNGSYKKGYRFRGKLRSDPWQDSHGRWLASAEQF